jgi:1-acyl-sn-glycerol-3-phosphate acyltransferase
MSSAAETDADTSRDASGSPFQRDPIFIGEAAPMLERALSWFTFDIRGVDDLPMDGPFLMVGNHSGGMLMPDSFALLLEWYKTRDISREVFALVYDLVFSIPGVGPAMRRLGGVPASHENARRALDRGAGVMVYPGGDKDAYRPWMDRNRIDLHGHKGFVRVALAAGVPVYPIVTHGSHDSIVVVLRGDRLAHALGLHRLRVNVLPILAGVPWGIAPVWMPMMPIPTKITIQVCEPIDWTGLGPAAADDPAVLDRCYDQILDRMQSCLDDLVRETPHPFAARLHQATLGPVAGARDGPANGM